MTLSVPDDPTSPKAGRYLVHLFIPDGPLKPLRDEFERGIARSMSIRQNLVAPQNTVPTKTAIGDARRIDLSAAGLWMFKGTNKIVLKFSPEEHLHYTMTFLKDSAELHETDERKKAAGEPWWKPLGRLTEENFTPRAAAAVASLRKSIEDHTLLIPMDQMDRYGFFLLPENTAESVLVGGKRKVSFSLESALTSFDISLERTFQLGYGVKYMGCFYRSKDRSVEQSVLGLIVFAPCEDGSRPSGFGFLPLTDYFTATVGIIGTLFTGIPGDHLESP